MMLQMGYLKDRCKQKTRVENKIKENWEASENLTEDEKIKR